jgi:hypothetical protein
MRELFEVAELGGTLCIQTGSSGLKSQYDGYLRYCVQNTILFPGIRRSEKDAYYSSPNAEFILRI